MVRNSLIPRMPRLRISASPSDTKTMPGTDPAT
jgi:hypothetical protein